MDPKAVDPQVKALTSTSLWQAMFLVKGQPHLRRGIPVIFRSRPAVVLLLCQIVLAVVITVRLLEFIQQPLISPGAEWLAAMVGSIERRELFEKLAQIVIDIGPLLFLLNITWPIMAEVLIYRRKHLGQVHCMFSPRVIVAGLMGLIPLRVIARYSGGFLPAWLTVKSADNAVVWSGKARLMQFYFAGYLATRINSSIDADIFEEVVHDAIKLDGYAIWDALGSYVLMPVIVGFSAIMLVLGVSVYSGSSVFTIIRHILASPWGLGALLVAVVGVVTSRAGLGALVFSDLGATSE